MDQNNTQVRVVKRYTNRKLYDTVDSKYVTLENIKAMLVAGQTVQVVDNVTKADITGTTLLSVLVETEADAQANVDTLKDVISVGGLSNYLANLKPKV